VDLFHLSMLRVSYYYMSVQEIHYNLRPAVKLNEIPLVDILLK